MEQNLIFSEAEYGENGKLNITFLKVFKNKVIGYVKFSNVKPFSNNLVDNSGYLTFKYEQFGK